MFLSAKIRNIINQMEGVSIVIKLSFSPNTNKMMTCGTFRHRLSSICLESS